MRALSDSRFLPLLGVSFGLALVALGALILTDRPGLELRYHALPTELDARSVYRQTADPQLARRQEVAPVLVSQEIFELRWSGWLRVRESGEYRFRVRADEASFLSVDGAEIARTSRRRRLAEVDSIPLQKGRHRLEVGMTQTGGRAWLEIHWGRHGEELERLAGEALIASPPVWLRSWLRDLLPRAAGWRKPVGGLGLFTGLILLAVSVAGRWPGYRRPWRGWRAWTSSARHRRWLEVGLLTGLFLIVSVSIFPYTASTADGDDVRYMDGARFDKAMGWNVNRYTHIYLLKGFILFLQGDAFQASRVYWAAMLGLTAVAMALSLRSADGRLRPGLAALALGILFAQTYLFGGVGAAYADYTAMMLVTLGTAVYLQGTRRTDGADHGSALALGFLAVLATRAKEPGIILLWPTLGLFWAAGRAGAAFLRRSLAWWAGGALGALALLMLLDGLVLDDPWFGLRPESQAQALGLRDSAAGIWQLSRWAWLEVTWSQPPLRGVWLLATVGAVAALWSRAASAWRWVAWMPWAYMALLIAVHPAIESPRYLFPIVPVACVVAADALGRFWRAQVAVPLRGPVRWMVVPLLVALLFGSGVVETRQQLVRHRVAQRGDWTLYPWQVFREDLETLRPRQIAVSPRLYRRYQMIGKSRTRDRLARLFFQRRHLRLRETSSLPRDRPAVVTRKEYDRWLADAPELSTRARFDPSGQIVLIRPE